jgi:acetoacetyl-CoA synthetase
MDEMMIEEGAILWEADAERRAGLNITKFITWLGKRGHDFKGYQDLWDWSVQDLAGFWQAIADYFELIIEGKCTAVVSPDAMPRTRWFVGSRMNYAEHILRHEMSGDPSRVMLHHSSELRPSATMSWVETCGAVRKLATRLRAMGIVPGDRIVAYMPNIPETFIAMLAATAIGAVWSSAAPEFGPQTVIDRFGQIEPKLIFACNGYRYGGKDFDRTEDLSRILAALPSAKTLVMLDYSATAKRQPAFAGDVLDWNALFTGADVTRDTFEYTRVASDHPLWILFTSGTTGLPKPIVQGHHGIVLEHYKSAAFHFELQEGGALFFYSTTGWMVWNTLSWGLLMNGRAVMYDGHPAYPDARLLWRISEEVKASVMGVSPTYIQIVKQQDIHPGAEFNLDALDAIMLVGSPSTPETFDWVMNDVKADVWASSQSGGTEFCSGLLAGSPLLPTRAGEIQAPALGVDACAFDDDGKLLINDVGELVIRKPMPSMPLYFWGDDNFARYTTSYLEEWPGIWRHGDRVKFNDHGGIFVLGRSDATLNRFGVRIGSAEIYRTMEGIADVADSLVICIEDGKGGFYMPLFVKMAAGKTCDDGFKKEIVKRLRSERSPRHVPDEIVEVPDIPVTLTGKKMEVPVRKIVMGAAIEEVASRDATRNPAALEWFVEFAKQRQA